MTFIKPNHEQSISIFGIKNYFPMKKRNVSMAFLLGLFLVLFSSNSDSTKIIYWDKNHRLEWTDFEGAPAYQYESISALTSSGIVHYTGCKDGQLIYKIQAYFEKDNSWVKEEARTNHHLAHEQIHFDITELSARKLRKALAKRTFKCGEEPEFENFIKAFLEQWQLEQRAFDMMSRHSLDKGQQRQWFYKVAMELSLLEEGEKEEMLEE